jgi:uncharacterized protein DUF4412
MKFAVFSLILVGLLPSARADLTLVQKVDGPGPDSQMTMKIKNDKARVDVNPQMTTIIDGKTGEMVNLMHDQKGVLRMSGDKMKAAIEMARQFSGKGEKKETSQKPKLVATGKKEIVGGFETEQYTFETPDFKATYWIAPKYPNGAAILKQLQSVNPGIWKTSNSSMPDYKEFPGLPIKTLVSVAGREITTTLVSVNQDPVSDAEFTVPNDYKEVNLSDLTGRPQQSATPSPAP